MTKKGKAPVLAPLGYSLKKFLWRTIFALIIVGSLLFIASRFQGKNNDAAEPSKKLSQ